MLKIIGKQDIVISKKDYDANMNKASLKGYKLGIKVGRQEGLMAKVTPNEIRKCFCTYIDDDIITCANFDSEEEKIERIKEWSIKGE